MADLVTVDVGHLLSEERGEHFVSGGEFSELLGRHRASFEKVCSSLESGVSPITRPFASGPSLSDLQGLASRLRKRYEAVLVIGIGGSTLGFRSAMQFLGGPLYNSVARARGLPMAFVVDNVDPTVAAQLDAVLDLSRTALVYISKSGATPEPAANFVHFYDRYRSAGGADSDVVIICDAKDNGINHIAGRLGCQLLHIPPDLPGRYSVLSSVGLLPCELIGISSEALLRGAGAMHASILRLPPEANGVFALAVCLDELTRKGKAVHVLFSYGSILSEFGLWFAQLWAESLGKERSLDGRLVRAGSTPLPALGATDQHSVLQLFREGPNDKVFGFVTLRRQPYDVELHSVFPQELEYSYFAGHTLAEQLSIEQVSTEVSLVRAGRPCYRLVLPDASPEVLGALFYFMEALVVVTAELRQVDPFTQPGVEYGKRLTYTLMGRDDLAGDRPQLEEELRAFERKRRLFTL